MAENESDKKRSDERLLLNAREVAQLLNVSRSTIYALHSAGRIPLPVRLGRAVRWRADELREWVAAGCPPRNRWMEMRER
jgi:excisionase family DNA binding protein